MLVTPKQGSDASVISSPEQERLGSPRLTAATAASLPLLPSQNIARVVWSVQDHADPKAMASSRGDGSAAPPFTPTTASFVVLTSDGETTTHLSPTTRSVRGEVARRPITAGTTPTTPSRGSAALRGLVASAPNLSRSKVGYPITQISAASFRKIGRHLAQSMGHHQRPRGVTPLGEIASRPSALPTPHTPTPVPATSRRHLSSRSPVAAAARPFLATTFSTESSHSVTTCCRGQGQARGRPCKRHDDDGCSSCRCCSRHSCLRDARHPPSSTLSLDWADIVFYMCAGSVVTFLWF